VPVDAACGNKVLTDVGKLAETGIDASTMRANNFGHPGRR
jgi:hypothetical protein